MSKISKTIDAHIQGKPDVTIRIGQTHDTIFVSRVELVRSAPEPVHNECGLHFTYEQAVLLRGLLNGLDLTQFELNTHVVPNDTYHQPVVTHDGRFMYPTAVSRVGHGEVAKSAPNFKDVNVEQVLDPVKVAKVLQKMRSHGQRFDGVTHCQADCDGDCQWEGCPQLRDGEPAKSGRSCPLWQPEERY